MGHRLVRKGLVIGIIFLFIGAGIYPAIAVKLNTSSTNTIDKVENKDISINDISNFNLDRLNLLMFFSMKPKLFTSVLKSYSKISDELCKLSSKDCLEIVDKMVKEKLTMTLNALKLIESKGFMDSSKTKSNYKDIYLKISEISSKYNELSLAFKIQDSSFICFILMVEVLTLVMIYTYLAGIADELGPDSIVYWIIVPIVLSLYAILTHMVSLLDYYDCIYFPYP